jgi:hypothetical protein
MSPKDPGIKSLDLSFVLLGGGKNFKRWGLLEGLLVFDGNSGPQPLLLPLLYFLTMM